MKIGKIKSIIGVFIDHQSVEVYGLKYHHLFTSVVVFWFGYVYRFIEQPLLTLWELTGSTY